MQIRVDGYEAVQAKFDQTEFTGAIVYCPVCATADDADQWGANELECNNCGTVYLVLLVPAIVHEHSMVG